MSFWSDRSVVVTGGAGFLGTYVVQKLVAAGARPVVPRSAQHDLRDRGAIDRYLDRHRPEIVFHVAATVGGIGANRSQPGRFFYDNAIMGIQLIESARNHSVKKFVCLGTICSYPKSAPIPFKEEDLWLGYPEETNAPYGLAKKMLLVQLQAYRQQYDFRGIYLMPVNLYGPGDNFDLKTSHVIPALIRKCVEAKRSGAASIRAWGTGQATREFLFVEDAAEAIVAAGERYDKPEPINVGSGQEIRIQELAELIRELTGFEGRIDWDASQPDGQPRRRLDTSKAKAEFGWVARTALRDGLRKTIDSYKG